MVGDGRVRLEDKEGNTAADKAFTQVLGPTTLWTRRLQGWPPIIVSPVDVGAWLCSVGNLVQH